MDGITTNGNGKPMVDNSEIMKGDAGAKAKDFAEYFCSYAFLYHQKQMLTDHRRKSPMPCLHVLSWLASTSSIHPPTFPPGMQAYHEAIMKNTEAFVGKTVVDVGTGTGVLAVWSAKAGAERVVAVEFTDMAKMARVIVERNGVSDTVEVVQGSAEEMDGVAPKSVDIIVSEWMGYFLLRESMLDSLLRVREKYLKPDGHMFPSHATMYWSLVDDERERQMKEQVRPTHPPTHPHHIPTHLPPTQTTGIPPSHHRLARLYLRDQTILRAGHGRPFQAVRRRAKDLLPPLLRLGRAKRRASGWRASGDLQTRPQDLLVRGREGRPKHPLCLCHTG